MRERVKRRKSGGCPRLRSLRALLTLLNQSSFFSSSSHLLLLLHLLSLEPSLALCAEQEFINGSQGEQQGWVEGGVPVVRLTTGAQRDPHHRTRTHPTHPPPPATPDKDLACSPTGLRRSLAVKGVRRSGPHLQRSLAAPAHDTGSDTV